MYRASTMTSARSYPKMRWISSNAAAFGPASEGTGISWKGISCHSTKERRSSWFETTEVMSHSMSPLRQR